MLRPLLVSFVSLVLAAPKPHVVIVALDDCASLLERGVSLRTLNGRFAAPSPLRAHHVTRTLNGRFAAPSPLRAHHVTPIQPSQSTDGWADSWHSPAGSNESQIPTLRELVASGIDLQRHYVFMCASSARYPHALCTLPRARGAAPPLRAIFHTARAAFPVCRLQPLALRAAHGAQPAACQRAELVAGHPQPGGPRWRVSGCAAQFYVSAPKAQGGGLRHPLCW
jgi:hypothetical protein